MTRPAPLRRPFRPGITVLVAALAAALAFLVPARAQDCAALAQEGATAAAAQDRAALSGVIERAAGCPELRFNLQIRLAALLWNEAVALNQSGAPLPRQVAALEAVLDQAPLWQAHAALGDIASEGGDHGRAAFHYQEALNSIMETALTPTEPPERVIAQIHRKAQVARMAAPVYVPTTRSRSGAPTGLATSRVRSFGVARVAVPVQFEFARTDFTEQGQAAVADLLDYLQLEGAQAITLVGHTDPVGSRARNMELSVQRAEAVAGWLRANGYQGRITVDGRGPDQPLEVDNPALYSTEQLHQIFRRVELVRQ
ncbi:MAG: OmpA family protein [Rhodobacteraceae bacterium]|nr:OmpA family protein [Paracoccaceae bacterium]